MMHTALKFRQRLMLYYLFSLSCLFVLKKYGELPHRLLTNGKICRNTDGSSCCIVKTAQGDFFDIRRKMQLFPTGSYPVRQRLLSESANHGAFVKKIPLTLKNRSILLTSKAKQVIIYLHTKLVGNYFDIQQKKGQLYESICGQCGNNKDEPRIN